MVEVETKDVGDVRDIRGGNYSWSVEEGCEDYIKKELGIDGRK